MSASLARKWVVGIDHYESSHTALDTVLALTDDSADEVHLVSYCAPALEDETIADLEKCYERTKQQIAERRVTTQVDIGKEWNARVDLFQLAKKNEASFFVMGTHTRGPVEGSVTEFMTKYAPCPLLIVAGHKTHKAPPKTGQSWLLCVDKRANAHAALAYLTTLTKTGDSVAIFTGSLDDKPESVKEAEASAQEASEVFRLIDGVNVSIHTAVGAPETLKDSIYKVAREVGAHFIVHGAHASNSSPTSIAVQMDADAAKDHPDLNATVLTIVAPASEATIAEMPETFTPRPAAE